MNAPNQCERMESALGEGDPSNALWSLAKSFKTEGMTQQEMSDLFDRFRVLHQDDTDETQYNAILDTMDFIVGWCSPGLRLFED